MKELKSYAIHFICALIFMAVADIAHHYLGYGMAFRVIAYFVGFSIGYLMRGIREISETKERTLHAKT